MAKQPGWARELKEQGINYAVLRYLSPPQSSVVPQQQPQGALPFSPMTISAGAGPDGVVQPNRTAMVDQGTSPPSKYHEGELITIHGNGVRNITPAQQTAAGSFMRPTTISQQSQMDQMPLPGYATGGVTYPKETITAQSAPAQVMSIPNYGAPERPTLETKTAPNTTYTPKVTDTITGSATQAAAPAATPVSTPSALSTVGQNAVSTGMDLLSKTALGRNPYLQNYGNQQLAEQSGAAAAGNAATLMSAKRSGASTPMLSTISQEATRSAENAQNTLRSNIYSKQQEAALSAADNLVNQGQQVRTYEDVTLPTSQANLASAKASADAAARDTVYNLIKERNLAGVWGDSLVNDAQIRAKVKSMLGETATAEEISREVGVIESALLDQNREVFNTQVDNTLSDMIENGYSLDQALNDETLLKKAAGYLRINDLTDAEGLVQAKEELSKRWGELGKPDAQRAYDNIVKNIIEPTMPDLVGNKDFSKDMMSTIGDLMTKGIIDAEGNIVADTAFDWPWNDPDTYFKYHDWNGNEAYGGEYEGTTALSIDGNGTKYKTSAGNAVTMADVNSVWNSPRMSSSDREKYFDEDGSFEMDKFLKDYGFRQNVDGDFTLTPAEDYERNVTEDPDFEKKVTDSLSSFNSIYNTDEITTGSGDTAVTSRASDSGKFVYYDEYGVKQTGNVMDGALGWIWQQLSDAAGMDDGELLSAKAFADKWNHGEGWRVDKDGKIINLWDKDRAGGESALNNKLLAIGTTAEGVPNFTEENMRDFSVTADDVKDVIATESWKNDQLKPYFVEPGSLEQLADSLSREDWFVKNHGKIYIDTDGEPYIVTGIIHSTGTYYWLDKVNDRNVRYKYNVSTGKKTEI